LTQNYHIGSVCLPSSDVGRIWQVLMASIMIKLRKHNIQLCILD